MNKALDIGDTETAVSMPERQRISRRVAENEWFIRLLEANPEAMVIVDGEGYIALVNERAERLFGYDRKEMLGNKLEMLIPKPLRERHQQHHQEYRKYPATRPMGVNLELTGLRSNGGVFPVDVSLSPLETEEGILVLSVIRDITDRKRAEKALLDRDAILESVGFAAEQFLKSPSWKQCLDEVLERLGRAGQVSRVHLYRNQLAGGILFALQLREWSDSSLEPELSHPGPEAFAYSAFGLSGWEESLGSGKPIHGVIDNFPESERVLLAHRNVASLAVVPVFVESKWWGFIGFEECFSKRIWTETELDALNIAASTLGAAIQRQTSQQELHESEERFSKSFHLAPVAISITTFEKGIIRDVNESFVEMTGYPHAEAIGHSFNELCLYRQPSNRDRIIERLLAEGSYHGFELAIRVKNGDTRYVMASAEAIELKGEHCILAMFYDVTERKRLEREIERIREGEQHKIGYDLHEDLAQQLAGVTLLSGAHLQKLEEENSSHVEPVRRINTMLGEAVSFSRNLYRRITPVDSRPDGLLHALQGLAATIEKVFGIPCRYTYGAPVLIESHILSTDLYRIAQEAAHIAIKYRKPRHIWIDLSKKNRRVLLKVKDDGVAVSDDALKASEDLDMRVMMYRSNKLGASLTVRKKPRCTLLECVVEG